MWFAIGRLLDWLERRYLKALGIYQEKEDADRLCNDAARRFTDAD